MPGEVEEAEERERKECSRSKKWQSIAVHFCAFTDKLKLPPFLCLAFLFFLIFLSMWNPATSRTALALQVSSLLPLVPTHLLLNFLRFLTDPLSSLFTRTSLGEELVDLASLPRPTDCMIWKENGLVDSLQKEVWLSAPFSNLVTWFQNRLPTPVASCFNTS